MYNEILDNIYGHISKMLDRPIESLTEAMSLLDDLGGKSYDYMHLAIFLESEYDIELPYMKFSKCKTLGEMAKYVAHELGC